MALRARNTPAAIGIGRRATGLNGDLVEHQRSDGFHALAGAIPFERGRPRAGGRERDRAATRVRRRWPGGRWERCWSVTVFGFDGDQQVGRGDRAIGRLLRGASGGELQLGALAAARHAVGEGGENAEEQGVFAVAAGEAGCARCRYRPTGETDARRRATIRFPGAPAGRCARRASPRREGARRRSAARPRRTLARHAAPTGFHQQTAEARMQRDSSPSRAPCRPARPAGAAVRRRARRRRAAERRASRASPS